MRVVALFRVSTERQATEGASLDAQERRYRELASQQGWQTIAEFRGCESATQAASDRRVLQQVLACLRERDADAIYVHEQSRLTRGDELEVATLFRELKERGFKVIVNGVIRDLASIDERFMVGIQSLVDRAESERLKERFRRGKREKARQGRKTSGPAPYGYCNPPPGAQGRGTLQVVAEEAPVVRRVFAMAAAGKGEHAIAVALNASGVPAPRGGKWGKSTVRRMLLCPAYIGTAATNVWVADRGKPRSFRFDATNAKAIIKDGAHEAIVDRETWDAVHGRAKAPQTRIPRMLCGLLWVGDEPYHGEASAGILFYRGPRGRRGLPWVESAVVDRAVWDAFASLATSPQFVERLLTESMTPRQRTVVEQEVEYLEGEIERQRRRLSTLLEMRAGGEIDKETYLAKSEEGRRAVDGLERDLREQRGKLVALDGTHAVRVVKAVQTLLAGRTRLTAEQKRSVLASIVRRVDVAVAPTGAVQKRGKGGGFAGSGGSRWKVESVSFRLALPVEEPAASGEAVGDRNRGLVTTSCGCDQVTVTGGGDGHRRSGTIS